MIAAGILMPTAAAANPLECRDWFKQADTALANADIRDAGAQRIEFFPHLRATRWLAAVRPEDDGRRAGRQWLRLLADEARRGWHAELLRLPTDASLAPRNRQARLARMEDCIEELLRVSEARGVPPLEIDDAYADWMRALGGYPITRWLATPSIHGYRREMAERFRETPPEPALLFGPPAFKGNPPRPSAVNNALDMPLPGPGATEALLAHYAPLIAVARTDSANLPGTVGLANGRPEVATHAATAYYWLSWTSFRGERLLQLNYQFWFSRRPVKGPLDIYAGRLDGIIWRVTLKPDGGVLTYDSIHPCGCYHKVYPVDDKLRPVDPDRAGQPVFHPTRVPDAHHQRVQLVLEPDTHYIVAVQSATDSDTPRRTYRMRHADRLRYLPHGRGYGSLYNESGLVAGSERAERLLLWPLGVPSAGAMRQPGHHAIAFVGKRHFDDPRVLEGLLEPRPLPR